MPRGAVVTGALLLSTCLLLAACGGGSGSPAAAAGGVVNGAKMPAARQPDYGALKESGTSTTQAARLVPASQSIVYTASLTIRSANAMATAKKAVAIVVAAGGYTADEHAVAGRSDRAGGTVSLTLKVPVPGYQQVLAELSAPTLGKQIALSQQATDVTEEVANVNSLVGSQQAAIAALQGLLRRAANVAQLLQVQQQISADESTLESLQAQQRALDRETSYATISMTVMSTSHAAVHRHAARRGFVAGLSAGWRAFRHAVAWLLTALGAALPFLVLLVILATAGYLGWRRLGRHRRRPTTAS